MHIFIYFDLILKSHLNKYMNKYKILHKLILQSQYVLVVYLKFIFIFLL